PDHGFLIAKRVPGNAQPGRGIETRAQRRRLTIRIETHADIHGQARFDLPAILDVAANVFSPTGPLGIAGPDIALEISGQDVHGYTQVEGLRRTETTQTSASGRCAAKAGAQDVDRKEQRNSPVPEVKLIVEPQVVFHVVIRQPYGCSEFQ